jgi:hypothetical protein
MVSSEYCRQDRQIALPMEARYIVHHLLLWADFAIEQMD